jgi:hypothetical protein
MPHLYPWSNQPRPGGHQRESIFSTRNHKSACRSMYRMTAWVNNVSAEVGEAEARWSVECFGGLLQGHLLEEYKI